MSNEIWKDIKGFEGIYQVSNEGRIKSLTRKVKANNDGEYTRLELVLTPMISSKGYQRVSLCKNGVSKIALIHRLVAEAFIPNENNLPQINHKDENKLNNHAENLEWCDNRYNLRYSSSKKVVRIDKQGCTKIYECMTDVIADGFNLAHVSNCCNGKRKTHKGYVWRFYD